ncbi:MAG: pitrilysin family protein [bacterium]|nr:pitrilysin family protein [bacterium]
MKFTKTILDNGLRVITIPMQDNPAVTVLVMVEAGSKYETKETNGISHFLEHMVFKGTPKRPNVSDISRELDGLGAESNAFTSDEYTGYYAKVDYRHIDTALDVISDMYLNPLFKEEEIEKEKGVIIEEIKMYRDLPQRQVHHILGSLLHGDQPAGWTILGPEENIRSFNRSHFIDYRSKHYVAGATVVVVAGAINEAEVIKKVEKLFADIPQKEKGSKLPVKELQEKPQLAVEYKKTDQTHLAMAVKTFPIGDKRLPIVKVMSAVLGKGMSSRLFTRMRDGLGICYYIRTSHSAYTDHGDLTISAGVDTGRVEMGIENIIMELNRLKTELVPERELKKAKDYIAGTTMLNLETSESQADYLGHQEVLKGDIKSPDRIIEDMNKVSSQEIMDLAREIFVNKNLNMAIVGPYEDKGRFEKLVSFDILGK